VVSTVEDVAARGKAAAEDIAQLLPQGRRSVAADWIGGLIDRLDAAMTGRAYFAVPADLLAEWAATAGSEIRLWNALLLATLIARLRERARVRPIPPSVLQGFVAQFDRIVAELATAPAGHLDLADDIFLKDLGLCRLHMFACAAQIVEQGAGVQRQLVLTGGVGQALRMIGLAWQLGGRFRPFFEIHTHTPMLGDFNPAGWDRCYHMVADLLETHPECQGLVGGSWFYDPAVEAISPRLAYLRRIPVSGGAVMLRGKPTRADIDNATATSESRRKLFEAGSYLPTKYLMVWPRAKLIAWSKRAAS
jgi:hypothetical protein